MKTQQVEFYNQKGGTFTAPVNVPENEEEEAAQQFVQAVQDKRFDELDAVKYLLEMLDHAKRFGIGQGNRVRGIVRRECAATARQIGANGLSDEPTAEAIARAIEAGGML